MIHFRKEAVLNAYVLYYKIKPGKCCFMNYKMDIIEATINRATIAEDTTIFIMSTVGWHFMGLIPPTEKKAKPQKRCVIFTTKGKRKRVVINAKTALLILVCLQHQASSSIMLNRTLFLSFCPDPWYELCHI